VPSSPPVSECREHKLFAFAECGQEQMLPQRLAVPKNGGDRIPERLQGGKSIILAHHIHDAYLHLAAPLEPATRSILSLVFSCATSAVPIS
jgi:hypothetical protein